jgi:hypothetical protein
LSVASSSALLDEIEIDHDSIRARYTPVPSEPASDPRFVKHVRCEGARFHVLWWSSQGCHCSEPRCIINKREPNKTVSRDAGADGASKPLNG